MSRNSTSVRFVSGFVKPKQNATSMSWFYATPVIQVMIAANQFPTNLERWYLAPHVGTWKQFEKISWSKGTIKKELPVMSQQTAPVINHPISGRYYCMIGVPLYLSAEWAAARRAIGTLKGEQLT